MSGTLPKRPAWVAIALQRYVYTYRNRRSSLKTLRSALSSRQDKHHMHHGYHITLTEIVIAHTPEAQKSPKLNLVIRKCGYLSKLRMGGASLQLAADVIPLSTQRARTVAHWPDTRYRPRPARVKSRCASPLGLALQQLPILNEGQVVKPATTTIFHTSFHHHSSDATTSVALRRNDPSNVFLTDPTLASSIRPILSFFPS